MNDKQNNFQIFGKSGRILSLALAGCLMLSSQYAEGQSLATWSFSDQGLGGNADLSATTAVGVSASDLLANTGYQQLSQWDDLLAANDNTQTAVGAATTYVDTTGFFARDSAGNAISTNSPWFYVGDWNDGGTGGGDVQQLESGGTPRTVNPSGAGPAESGALYLLSPAAQKNDVTGALTSELGLIFDVTADAADVAVGTVSFYGARDAENPDRSWETWHLLYDATGTQTFTDADVVFSSGDGDIGSDELWSFQETSSLGITISQGDTGSFLLLGTDSGTSGFGRESAIDEISVNSNTAIPEPSSLAVLGLAGLAVVARRRR